MKREIKFRCWHSEDKLMIPWDVVFFTDESKVTGWSNDFRDIEKIGNILMQYTGLKDKNGIEIYEGDIVKAHWPYARIAVVEWMSKRCSFHYHPIKEGFSAYDKGYKMNSRCGEVIGNIYENKELIK